MKRTRLIWVGLVLLGLGRAPLALLPAVRMLRPPTRDPSVPRWGAVGRVEASIAIDAKQKGQPISKYVYGQFIEHLGRCIYGGIWAEMLEDRKFYYPDHT